MGYIAVTGAKNGKGVALFKAVQELCPSASKKLLTRW